MTKTAQLVTAFMLFAGALAAGTQGCGSSAAVEASGAGSGTSTGAGGMANSSSSAVGSSGTGTGTGGACPGGAKACATSGNCPASPTACVTDSCAGGCCGTNNVVAGTPCADSHGKVCDGNGTCVACAAPGDCTAQPTACVTNTCAMGACGTKDATSGTVCTDNGGKLCDGGGHCVACLSPSDCPAPTTACKTNTCSAQNACGTSNAAKGAMCTDGGGTVCDGNGTCVAATCVDGFQDGTETDVDCGGASCAPCGDGQKCVLGTDCQDKVCNPVTHTCSAPTCSDGVQNGMETDVDCGGATCDGQGKTCGDLKHCGVSADCTNGDCFGNGPGVCVSCMDGVEDGNETGVDCGGAQCDAQGLTCAPGIGCSTAADCMSGFCQGNTTCALRPDGQSCTAASQCADDYCVGPAGNQICCNDACAGNCEACTMALTGVADGTCATIAANNPAPAGQCLVTTTCGNDGDCDGLGNCQQANATVVCAPASCSNGQYTAAADCNGNGTCIGTAPAACPGGFICASGTACLTACASTADCVGPGAVCVFPGVAGTCLASGTSTGTGGSGGAGGSGGGTACVSMCISDAQCQASCPNASSSTNCCDVATGSCYVTANATCPAQGTGGGSSVSSSTGY